MEPQKSLEELKEDVKRARRWAEAHFNVDQKEDHLLAPPVFDIEWLDMDKFRVYARSYGHRLWPHFEYRLAWVNGNPAWISKHPFSGAKIVLHVGTHEEIAEIEHKFDEARERLDRSSLQGSKGV